MSTLFLGNPTELAKGFNAWDLPPILLAFKHHMQAMQTIEKYKQKAGLCFINDVHIQDLIDQWNVQKGLCAYSGIPLKLTCNTSQEQWAALVARVNHQQAFGPGNILFVWKYFTNQNSVF